MVPIIRNRKINFTHVLFALGMILMVFVTLSFRNKKKANRVSKKSLTAKEEKNAIIKRNDWDKRKLKGKVKKITHVFYEQDKRTGKRKRIDSIVSKFNQHGQLEEEISYEEVGSTNISKVKKEYDKKNRIVEELYSDSAGKSYYRTTYKYDERGNKIESYLKIARGEVEEKQVYAYNEKNEKVKMKMYLDNELEWKISYVYDGDGNKITEKKYIGDSQLERKIESTYDKDGIKREMIENNYNRNTDDHHRTFSFYDDKEQLVGVRWYDMNGEGSPGGSTVNKYDMDGNQIEMIKYNGDGSLYDKLVYSYNKMAKKTDEVRYKADGNKDYHQVNTFDDRGNLIGYKNIDENGNTKMCSRIDYKYDKMGNWIYKESILNRIPERFEKREIVYFPK